jgi:hypothetical protein
MKIRLTFEVELFSYVGEDEIMDAVSDIEVNLHLLGDKLKTELIEVGTEKETLWAA